MNLLNIFNQVEELQIYPAGATIFAENEPGDVMYVVLGGEIDIQRHGRSIRQVGPGELIGEMALIDSSPRSATAVALEECQLLPINEQQFLTLVEKTPFFALHVMRVLVERLRDANEHDGARHNYP